MQAHFDPDAAAAYEPPQPVCEPLQPNDVLDSLADSTEHAARLKKLDEMTDKVTDLVRCLGKEPVLPTAKPTVDGARVEVIGGGVITPPQRSVPAPEAAPMSAAADCLPEDAKAADGATP